MQAPWHWNALPSGAASTAPDAPTVWALQRPALTGDAQYRVLILPGSGCTAWQSIASRYTAGLLHAEVTLLHKPGVDLHAPQVQPPCAPEWSGRESLAAWRNQARQAVAALAHVWAKGPALPTVLVGVSEGAELLPALQAELKGPLALVLVGSSGLDPRDQGAAQMAAHGAESEWAQLAAAIQSTRADGDVLHGRPLRYWRDFWHWPLMQPLLDSSWPLLRAWGSEDASVPSSAYQAGWGRAEHRPIPWCDLVIQRGDHGLQRPDLDGMQQVWVRLESWARSGADTASLCPSPLTRVE
ncbi:alpha/beta hydrolase [Hydrogenophaga soli]